MKLKNTVPILNNATAELSTTSYKLNLKLNKNINNF